MMTFGAGAAATETGRGASPRTTHGEKKLAVPAAHATMRSIRFDIRLRPERLSCRGGGRRAPAGREGMRPPVPAGAPATPEPPSVVELSTAVFRFVPVVLEPA